VRQIVYDVLEPIRGRITKDEEQSRNNKHDIEKIGRDVLELNAQIGKLN